MIINVQQVIDYCKESLGLSYSRTGMQDLLHCLGYTYKQLELFPCKIDVDKQKTFVSDYKKLCDNLGENEEIVFLDAVHPQHNTHASRTWSKVGEKEYMPSNCGRQRVNINGAYNANNQDIIVREDETINADSTIELLEQIRVHYQEKTVYCILDNARYYRSKKVKEYLEKHPNIIFKFLPPYSPNLNLIERLWKLLKKGTVKTHFHETYQEFKNAIFEEIERLKVAKEELAKFIGTKFQTFENCNLVSV